MKALLVILLFCVGSFASLARGVGNEAQAKSPALSEAGKRRIRDNISTLEKNIENAHVNLTAIAKNKETIRQELSDLESLEKEHVELRKKYSAYLTDSEQELKKNENAIRELEAWEKKSQNDSRRDSAAFKEKWESVQREKAERQRWKTDAAAKIERVGKLMVNLLKDVQEIESRKGPLRSELNDWSGREKEYQKLLTEMTNKKVELEKMAKE